MSVLNNRLTAVLAGSALVVGLGASGAVAGSLITSQQIEDGTIRAKDLTDNLRGRTLTDSGATEVRADEPYTTTIQAGQVGVAFTACPEGKTALGGGFRINGFAAEAFQGGGGPVPGVSAIASEPVGVLDGQIVNTYQTEAFPQDASGAFLPNAWAVTVHNDSAQAQDVRVAVVCATID